jgi:hypothetical protein
MDSAEPEVCASDLRDLALYIKKGTFISIFVSVVTKYFFSSAADISFFYLFLNQCILYIHILNSFCSALFRVCFDIVFLAPTLPEMNSVSRHTGSIIARTLIENQVDQDKDDDQPHVAENESAFSDTLPFTRALYKRGKRKSKTQGERQAAKSRNSLTIEEDGSSRMPERSNHAVETSLSTRQGQGMSRLSQLFQAGAANSRARNVRSVEPPIAPTAADNEQLQQRRATWLNVMDASTTSEHEHNTMTDLERHENVRAVVQEGIMHARHWEKIQRIRVSLENLHHEQTLQQTQDVRRELRETAIREAREAHEVDESRSEYHFVEDHYNNHSLEGIFSFPSIVLVAERSGHIHWTSGNEGEWLRKISDLLHDLVPGDTAAALVEPASQFLLQNDWQLCLSQIKLQYALDCTHRRMQPQYELLTTRNEDNEDGIEGLEYFNEGMRLLDCFSFVRSADQRRFHDAIMITMARHIIKDDYLLVRERLLRRFKLKSQNMATLILCPRRWGKSTSVAMVLAVMLRVSRGIDIVIFSTGEDSSATLLQMTKDFYLQLPGAEKRITVNRRGMICTLPANIPTGTLISSAMKRSRMTSNTLMSRSGNVTGNRGITADCFILEEAAFIPRGILTQIIAPMLKVSNSVLIALSTHNGEENYYSRLFNDQDPAMDRLFIRLRVELVCATCKRLDRNPTQCTHVAHLNPAWLLASNEDRVKKLMGGDAETYAREVLGAFWSDSNSVFKKRWLDALEQSPPYSIDSGDVAMIVTMIDPAGGGSSMTAMVTIARTNNGNVIVLGLAEANVMEGPDLERVMTAYIGHFVADTTVAGLPHYLCVERNYGGSLVASTFFTLAQKACPHIIEHVDVPQQQFHADSMDRQPFDRTHGVWTSADVKRNGVITLAWELHDKRLHFAPYLATSVAVDQPVENKQRAMANRTRLLQQLGQFKKHFKPNGSWYYTGKDGRGGRDDLAMCLVLILHHSYVIGTRGVASD